MSGPTWTDALVVTVAGTVAGAIAGGWFGALLGFYCGASAGAALSNGGGILRLSGGDRSLRREAYAEAGRGYGAAFGAAAGCLPTYYDWWDAPIGVGALVGHAAGGAVVGILLAGYWGRAVFSLAFAVLPDAGVGLGLWIGTDLTDSVPFLVALLVGVVTAWMGWTLGTFVAGFVGAAAGFQEPVAPSPYGAPSRHSLDDLLGLDAGLHPSPPDEESFGLSGGGVSRPPSVGSGFRSRCAVLHLSPEADLPLLYSYDDVDGRFWTVGYVRAEGAMIIGADHHGPDTPAERDRFLLKVLTALTIPPGRARRIVAKADHVR